LRAGDDQGAQTQLGLKVKDAAAQNAKMLRGDHLFLVYQQRIAGIRPHLDRQTIPIARGRLFAPHIFLFELLCCLA
jgi:hypothetical protein